MRDIQRTLLWPHLVTIYATGTGLSPSLDAPFQVDFPFAYVGDRRAKHHTSPWFPTGIRFVLFRFRSPLITESHLISFPPATEMLQFAGFPLADASDAGASGGPIQPSTDPRHSCASPWLIAACHDLLRHRSRVIPQLGVGNHHTTPMSPSVSRHADDWPRRGPCFPLEQGPLSHFPGHASMTRCIAERASDRPPVFEGSGATRPP